MLVSSFDPVALVQFHRHLPDVALALPVPRRAAAAGSAAAGSAAGSARALVHPQHTLVDEASVTAWHTAGLPINVWTVDDEAELLRLAALGVDGVFANDPAHALAVLGA